MKKLFLLLSCFLLLIGNCAGPMISRLYFIYGGKRIWLSSFFQSAGCPIILIPLAATYIHRRRTQGSAASLILINPFLLAAAAVVGLLFGAIDYSYAYGSSKLPVSTSSLITSSQLAFTAGFSVLLVKQRFTSYSVNTVVLLTVGAAALAFESNSDRPEGESKKEYVVGFLMTAMSAAMNGFVMPLTELGFKKAKQDISFTLLMEFQMVLCISASAFCSVGMLINNDFKGIAKEAKNYELGEANYYGVLIYSAIVWQCVFLGVNGVIFFSSSLLSGILLTVSVPITELLAVIFYHETFQIQKGIALFLYIWGFVSYFYGETKYVRKTRLLLEISPE